MSRFFVSCVMTAIALVVPAATGPAAAAEKDKPALKGDWEIKGGKLRIEFSGDDVMKVMPHGDPQVVVVTCKYTVDAKGMVKAKITALEGEKKEKAQEIIPVGHEFSFIWTAKDQSASLDKVEGEQTEVLKSHLEGEYQKK